MQFRAETYNNLEGIYAYLFDHKTATLHDLKNGGAYSFQAEKGRTPTRFEVVFSTRPLQADELFTDSQTTEPLIFAVRGQVRADLRRTDELSGTLTVYTQQGAQVAQYSFRNEYQITLPVSARTGVYLVQLQVNGKIFSQRVMLIEE